jgi:U3 small nucleolar RNA-associated protein 3
MAKKRKAPRSTEPAGPRDVDSKDARLTIKTYEDVADSGDEYWAKQDRIDLNDDDRDADERSSKRLKRQAKEDAFLELSDEEILRDEDTEDSVGEEEEEKRVPIKRKGGKVELSEDEEERGGEEEEDEGWWGASKGEYYNADQIETEADALVGCLLVV